MFCSYLIQHFRDTFRQSILDLIHGNISDYKDIKIDETIKILTSLEISGFYHYGALNNELQLVESLLTSTRLIISFTKFSTETVFSYLHQIFYS